MTNLRTERKTSGALRSPYKFARYGESGLEVSELFAETAKHADDLCVIRSMVAGVSRSTPRVDPPADTIDCASATLRALPCPPAAGISARRHGISHDCSAMRRGFDAR